MICTSCNRNLASTLSVCPSCGTMVFDSVREELALKISPIAKSTISEIKEKPVVSVSQILPPPKSEAKIEPAMIKQTPPVEFSKTIIEESVAVDIVEPVVVKRTETAELIVKPTSKTLTDFNHKNATLPEWRLQMQNAVVKRRGGNEGREESSKPQVVAASVASRRTGSISTSGATALKLQTDEKPAVANAELSPLERALMRIEASRQQHFVEETRLKEQASAAQSSIKYFPSVSPNRSPEFFPKTEQPQSVAKFAVKPNVASISELRTEKKFDTNKLPPLPAKIASNFENRPIVHTNLDDYEDENFGSHMIDDTPDVAAYTETPTIEAQNTEDIDDCAPLALRFNSALFDLLIGSFISLLLLSPFMLLSENFFSTQGFLAFLATSAVVLFVYMTLTIGFLGRTFGMKMFSLEIIDIDENAYPTVHQAAVSSCVYLVSLALGGLGFLTLFLNNEKRAAHDLLSGTIIVKEY